MNTIQILFLTAIVFGLLRVAAGYCEERGNIPNFLVSVNDSFFNILRWSIPAGGILYALSQYMQIRPYMYFVVPAVVAVVELVRHAKSNSSRYGHAK